MEIKQKKITIEKYKYRIKTGCIELQIEGMTNNNSERKRTKDSSVR